MATSAATARSADEIDHIVLASGLLSETEFLVVNDG